MSTRRPSLPRLLKRCQHILELDNWHITAQYVTQKVLQKHLKELGVKEGYGLLMYEKDHNTAKVLLLDPHEYTRKPGDLLNYSVRFWLLHELTHLHTQKLVGDAVNDSEEEFVNIMARAFDSLL